MLEAAGSIDPTRPWLGGCQADPSPFPPRRKKKPIWGFRIVPIPGCAAGLEDSVRAKLDKLINGSRILLFMKGTRFYPQCGFSRTAVQVRGDAMLVSMEGAFI